MKEFLGSYWYYLVALVISASTFIVSLLKKSKIKMVDTPFMKLVLKLPEIISKAEKVSSVGHEKKSFVLGVAYAFLSDLTGKSIEDISFIYKDRISTAIESILETPQKKEVI